MSAAAPASPVSSAQPSHRKRNLLLIVIGIVVIGGIVGGGYGLWYILVGPSAPSESVGGPAIPADATVAAPASLDGTWNVNTSLGPIGDASASFAGYRVQEQLVGVGGHTAVGRTTEDHRVHDPDRHGREHRIHNSRHDRAYQ